MIFKKNAIVNFPLGKNIEITNKKKKQIDLNVIIVGIVIEPELWIQSVSNEKIKMIFHAHNLFTQREREREKRA